ncbi:MAG: amino acid adenylation domain-containing protein, partial [Bacteroidota bacterium]
ANRTNQATEKLIGFFVNTLVMRTDFSGDPTFHELLGRVREAALGAFAHQDLPFEKLVEDLNPVRDQSRNPLFHVMFSLQSTTGSRRLASRGMTIAQMDLTRSTSMFDVTVLAAEAEGGLELTVEYNADLFDPETIERMMKHFQNILESALANPGLTISRLSILTEWERKQIIHEWNKTERRYRNACTLHRLFEEQVQRTPALTAIECDGETILYSTLNERANQLAYFLREMGVRPEDPVAICMGKSVRLLTAILGVLKAGGCYVPLDPTYPRFRLTSMIEEVRPTVMLSEESLRELISGNEAAHVANAVYLDSEWGRIEGFGREDPPEWTFPESVAYMIYTSGSTGRPKGVSCRHGGVISLLAHFESLQPLKEGAGSSLWSSQCFDVSVYEIFSPLLSGGILHIVPEPCRPDAGAFFEWLAERGIGSAYIPPFMISSFAAWCEARSDLSWLKRLLVGVEPIHESLLSRISKKAPHLRIINGYGPTESTICCTLFPFDPIQARERNVPIGRPVWNSRIYVLDKSLQAVPIGVVGELFVGGLGLSRGYFNRQDLTAERFIPDPFSGQPGSRLYRTGDLVHYLPDGNIEFIGRGDYQVKIRGYRIELGEIESVLSIHPAVRKCVAVAWAPSPEGDTQQIGDGGDKLLIAYVVPTPGESSSSSDLRDFARSRLPDYMVPSIVVFLNALPLTPTGKVDRKALPAPPLGQAGEESSVLHTASEEIVANIWADVLHINAVAANDDFFALGGHSLLATQVLSRVREAFQCDLPLRSIFEHSTVAEFASLIGHTRTRGRGREALVLSRTRDTGEAPLSFAQQRLWFLDQLEPGSAQYHIPGALHVRGRLELSTLRESINEIIRRHEILRTVFASEDGRAVQRVKPELVLEIPLEDLRKTAAGLREAESLRIVQEEATRPFDLCAGPLVRARVVQLAEEDYHLVFVMHHIISDGWSMGVLIRELALLYRAFSAGERSPLEELTIQYSDYAGWQREWLKGEVLDGELDYWKHKLSGTPRVLELPYDRRRPAVQSDSGAQYEFSLSAQLTCSLRELSRRENATLFMTTLAALNTLLWRYTGEQDVCVGTPIANRNRAEVEGLIGFFVNTLVLRTDLSGDPSVRELIRRVREAALEAYEHQDVPFEKVVEAVKVERDLSRTPLFQVMFVMQNVPGEVLELSGVRLEPMSVETGVSPFDLTVTLTEEGDALAGAMEYNTDLFDRETIAQMVKHFTMLLEEWAGGSDQRISQLHLMTEEERTQIANQGRGEAMPWELDRSITRLIEAQVERNPEAIAVKDGDCAVTYHELNSKANQLAHFLRKRDVGPETLVGLLMDRSTDMCISVLAILKTGAGYVPLDSRYPPERLAVMCADSGAGTVLTQIHLRSRVPETVKHILVVDTLREELDAEEATNLETGADGENIAYVIYTSGSTGAPKGVAVKHSGVINHNLAVQDAFGLTSEDRVLQFSSISFDAAVEEMLPAWETGATVVLRNDEVIGGGEALAELIVREGISVLDLPTAFWSETVQEMSVRKTMMPESVRLVAIGGEKVVPERLAKWVSGQHGGCRWLNTYGPTETTIISTLYDPGRLEEWDGNREVPLGRPIANTQVYVVNEALEVVPVGVTGEIVIGGAGVARGYHRRPELTAERFLPDPFGWSLGGRLYRTGDLGRYKRDGLIEYRGRIDHQVKIRGFRVELDEVEGALLQHPLLREAVVALREDRSVKRLVAYYVLQENAHTTAAELRMFLKTRLPEFMVPSAFVMIESMPHTVGGKIDRRAVAGVAVGGGEEQQSSAAPVTEAEKVLAEIWCQVLGVNQVGVNDNFFELGGDSILSIQVIARANQKGLRLTAKDLFQYPTVHGLGSVAQMIHRGEAEQGTVTGHVPLTPIQQWFFEQDVPEVNHWNQSLLFEVREELSAAEVGAVVRSLLEHHDALRMRFRRGAAGWTQWNAGVEEAVPVTEVDL